MPDEQPHPADIARIDELEHQGKLDRDTIAVLQHQNGVDQKIIEALLDQGEVDRVQIANLQEALKTARRIGAAMGILMSQRQLSQEAAFDALRVNSQHSHRKLREVAEDVLYTGAIRD
jgi:hypothetical protein